MHRIRFLSLLVLVFVTSLPALAGPALQTPPPTLTVTLTVTTGADGTNDSPTIAFKTIDGAVLGSGALNQPGDLAPGVTNVYSYSVNANFCDITQFELLKPPTSGSDDSWQISALRLSIDGTEVFVNLAPSSTITAARRRRVKSPDPTKALLRPRSRISRRVTSRIASNAVMPLPPETGRPAKAW